MSNLIGQSLGRYHILEKLGEGGMAFVYKAYDTQLEREVAIKIIRRKSFPEDQLERMLKRFEREAKALAKLSHPNIVKILKYGEHEGMPYLVMDYLPGGTLKERLKNPMPWQETIELLIAIAQTLDYAHEQHVIHRDIKPSNILLTEKGQPMLTDFGIAKMLETEETATLTGTGVGVGTPEYMAPEQGRGLTDARSDVYSLGIVLYEMVTGRKPFVADTPLAMVLMHISDPLPSPRQFVPKLPAEIEKIIIKALAKDPANRYQTMGEFANALEKPMTHSPYERALIKRESSRLMKFIPRWLWFMIGGIIVFITGGLFLYKNIPVSVAPSLTSSTPSVTSLTSVIQPTSLNAKTPSTIEPSPANEINRINSEIVRNVLSTIQTSAPDENDDFSSWASWIPANENSLLLNGKLFVTSKSRIENQSDTWQASESQLATVDSMVIRLRFKILELTRNDGHCSFEMVANPGDPQKQKAMMFSQYGDGRILLTLGYFQDGNEIYTTIGQSDAKFDFSVSHTIIIIILKENIYVLVDDLLAYNLTDPMDLSKYEVFYLSANMGATCEYDDFSFWDFNEIGY